MLGQPLFERGRPGSFQASTMSRLSPGVPGGSYPCIGSPVFADDIQPLAGFASKMGQARALTRAPSVDSAMLQFVGLQPPLTKSPLERRLEW